MRLGELLIKKGLLTPGQLDTALKSQLIVGGHLGTSLIELGFIDEATLGDVLSTMSGAPYAKPHLFQKIGETTIAAVPVKIAEEYLAFPLKVDEKFIHLALVNPGDLRALDEISFAIGRKIKPWVAPEVRLYQALEEYYGLPRRPRFITLGHQLDEALERNRRASGATASVVAVPSDGKSVADEANRTAELPPDGAPMDDAHDVTFGYGKSWRDVADELDRRESSGPVVHPAKPVAQPAPHSPMRMSELVERYCRAEALDDLAQAALDFGVGRAERMLFMTVTNQKASVWHERGFALTKETRRTVSLQCTSEALFHLLMGDDHYYGALPPDEDAHAFFRNLGVEAPQDLLLIPIRVNDLLVAMVLADGGSQGRVQGEPEELLKAFRLFGMSVSLLAMKRKIRDAARTELRSAATKGTGT